MDGDRTESDWQGLVSEVRPGLWAGLGSRCSGSASPARPGSRWPPQICGCTGHPALSGLRGRRGLRTIWCQALGRGLSPASVRPRIGETEKPWDPGGKEPSPTCLPGHHWFGGKRLDDSWCRKGDAWGTIRALG